MTVVTYGGGEILRNIFDAIAMLLNGSNGGFLRPLLLISVSIGTLWAVTKAFFSNSAQSFLSQFIIPIIGIVGILMIPTSPVHIEDVLKDRSYKVDHVPILLAKFSELASSVGYQITKAVEKVMHVPNDVSYNSTGMIFGADTAMDISRYQITNADLEKNLRSFCKQCVLYDLALGRYTVDEMKKSCDLWKFFEDKTSKVRMLRYQPIGSNGNEMLGEYLSCKDAIKKMTPFFEQEKRYFGQLDVCRHLPLTFQALTGMQKDKEELISQQLMMNVLLDEYGGQSFAKGRAYLQQRNTYQALGSLASSSLVTLRAVIEALVYAAFIFILPLSVLPGGLKFISTWVWLVLWIQLWPPFYAILNYIMQSVAHGYADTIFTGLAGANQGLSLFTSVGLHNLQHDIYALSGYLAASIPFITYAVLKGGVGSFIHLAGSMMTPAHTAASAAAAEQTTGNYSFGNASYGQTSYQNTSGFNTALSPNLSTGFFHENKGTHSAIYGSDEQILKQSNSELRTSVFSDDSISQSLQKAQMHAQSTAENSQQSYTEGLSTHSRHLADLSDHLSKSDSFSENVSEREAYDLQESARYFQNLSENWGKQYGLSSRQGMETVMGLGLDFGITAKSSTNLGSNKEHLLNTANNVVKSEEFQKHFQRLQDFSQAKSYNSQDETGMRLVESCSQSLENMKSSQESYQIAQSNLDQVSENATWAQQNSHLIRRSLNQDFVNWASEQYTNEGGFSRVEEILTKGNTHEQESLVGGFVDFVRSRSPSISSPQNYVDPATSSRSLPKELSMEEAQDSIRKSLSAHEPRFAKTLPEMKEAMTSRYSQVADSNQENFGQVANKIENTRKSAVKDFQSESDRPLFKRSFDEVGGVTELIKEGNPALAKLTEKLGLTSEASRPIPDEYANNFQVTEEPFWMNKKEVR